MRKFLVILVLHAVAATAGAQSSRQVTQRYLAWGTWLQQVNFNERWHATLDLQVRYEYTDNDLAMLIVRPSVGYITPKKFTFAAGIGYIRLYPNPNGVVSRPEWRPWQEVGKKFKTPAGSFWARVRVEERFIREYAGTELQEDFSYHSLRYRIRCDWMLPLGKTPAKGMYLAAGNEFFLATRPGNFTAFDQNRAYAGPGYRFSPALIVQLHYLNVYQQFNSSRYEMHHVVRLAFTCELNLPEKDEQPAK